MATAIIIVTVVVRVYISVRLSEGLQLFISCQWLLFNWVLQQGQWWCRQEGTLHRTILASCSQCLCAWKCKNVSLMFRIMHRYIPTCIFFVAKQNWMLASWIAGTTWVATSIIQSLCNSSITLPNNLYSRSWNICRKLVNEKGEYGQLRRTRPMTYRQ